MNVQRQIDRLIALQAADWYERLKNELSPGHKEFVDWIGESPRHMDAFLAIAGEAPLIRRAFAEGSFNLETLLQSVTPEVLPLALPPERQTLSRNRERGKNWRHLKLWAVAAAVAMLAVGAVFYRAVLSWQHFETPIGEQRTVQLPEGSVVNLNALSRVDVRFNEHRRDIRLLRGEATFKVARDPARPFRVHTPSAVVEAVGTQFNVYARADGSTMVSVLEGKVRVLSEGSPAMQLSPAPVPLAAGEEAQVKSSGRIERERPADVAEAIAWQQRKLIFKRTPLEEMAAEFNRYNRTMSIRLEGIAPGAFRFSGAFNADDPQSLAVVLMREPGLAVQQGPDEIVIRAAAP